MFSAIRPLHFGVGEAGGTEHEPDPAGAYIYGGVGSMTPQMLSEQSLPLASESAAHLPLAAPVPVAPTPAIPMSGMRTPSMCGSDLHVQSPPLPSTPRSSSSRLVARPSERRRMREPSMTDSLPYTKEFVSEYRTRMKADPDPEAQFSYAMYLIEAAKRVRDPGDGPKQARRFRDSLLTESIKLVKRLASRSPPYAEAQFFLANCYGNGSLGMQVDHSKSYHYYVQASKQNHAAATYRTAVCNEVGAGTKRNPQRALLFYRKAASLGDTAGMYKLGMVLLYGALEQPPTPRESIVWLKRAAGQADEDNPHALHELALLYENIDNGVVPPDEVLARNLFMQAAQIGYTPSQCKLGDVYANGLLGCPVDPRASIGWHTLAANKGDGNSELALSGWFLTGADGVLQQSDTEAYLWARRAVGKGVPKAEYAVGYYTEVGIGVGVDIEEAKRWYTRAATQGEARAQKRLADLRGAVPKGSRPTRADAASDCVIM